MKPLSMFLDWPLLSFADGKTDQEPPNYSGGADAKPDAEQPAAATGGE